MKAKDTVIKKILGIHGYTIEEAESILNNAGRAIYQAGIKEVAEWLERFCESDEGNPDFSVFPEEAWQAKLKEWGISG